MYFLKHEGTREQLFARYHTVTRRPNPGDARSRKLIFASFRRVLGPWLPPDKDARILDVACGEGWLLRFLCESGYRNLSAFDISPENVNLCHELGLDFVRQFDALRISEFEKGKAYDSIFALDILEHIPKSEVAQFIENLRVRLAPGGTFLVQTPNMGCVFGLFQRYYDLSHEFCLTEKSAIDLMMLGGFERHQIEVHPAWNATTMLGRLRELHMRLLHKVVFLAEDSGRPRIPTKNLLIVARR